MICGENRESASSLVYGQSRGTFRTVWGQLRFVAGQRLMPRERIAQHLSERAPTDAGSHVNRPRRWHPRRFSSVLVGVGGF